MIVPDSLKWRLVGRVGASKILEKEASLQGELRSVTSFSKLLMHIELEAVEGSVAVYVIHTLTRARKSPM